SEPELGSPPSITADGNTLYYAEDDQAGSRIARYDIRTDTPALAGATPDVHLAAVAAPVAIRPDGSRVYRANGEVWSSDLQTRLGTLPVAANQPFWCIAYVPQNDLVFNACQNPILRMSGTSFAVTATRQAPGGFAAVMNGPGKVAYVGTLSGLEAVSFDA